MPRFPGQSAGRTLGEPRVGRPARVEAGFVLKSIRGGQQTDPRTEEAEDKNDADNPRQQNHVHTLAPRRAVGNRVKGLSGRAISAQGRWGPFRRGPSLTPSMPKGSAGRLDRPPSSFVATSVLRSTLRTVVISPVPTQPRDWLLKPYAIAPAPSCRSSESGGRSPLRASESADPVSSCGELMPSAVGIPPRIRTAPETAGGRGGDYLDLARKRARHREIPGAPGLRVIPTAGNLAQGLRHSRPQLNPLHRRVTPGLVPFFNQGALGHKCDGAGDRSRPCGPGPVRLRGRRRPSSRISPAAASSSISRRPPPASASRGG